jgi:hypothetical protein
MLPPAASVDHLDGLVDNGRSHKDVTGDHAERVPPRAPKDQGPSGARLARTAHKNPRAADQQINIGMGYAPGEALCGSLAELVECQPGLFPPPVTCQRCVAIAAAEHVEIAGGQL